MGRTSNAKERLLQVAFDLIWQQSYGSVSVDHICKRANVKKGSFYYFFPSNRTWPSPLTRSTGSIAGRIMTRFSPPECHRSSGSKIIAA